MLRVRGVLACRLRLLRVLAVWGASVGGPFLCGAFPQADRQDVVLSTLKCNPSIRDIESSLQEVAVEWR